MCPWATSDTREGRARRGFLKKPVERWSMNPHIQQSGLPPKASFLRFPGLAGNALYLCRYKANMLIGVPDDPAFYGQAHGFLLLKVLKFGFQLRIKKIDLRVIRA